MSLLVPPRRPSDEILDDPDIPAEEMFRSLQDLALVNRWWGSARALERFLVGEIRRLGVDRPVVIDAGAGSADVSRRLARALDEYEIAGVETTLPLFRALTGDPEFREGRFHTQWLDGWLAGRSLDPPEATLEEAILAAACVSLDGGRPAPVPSGHESRWKGAAREEALRPPLLDRSRRRGP